ncbi:MAG: hypothetical protein GWN01_09430 [Nitrosopumilaceae archaeon]|nr:hypothetical protein [Nitrosopumilaceae archaeon]NIU87830.1 hypothetical protein [Nitrosopumilaceae archaeon]NIV65212.1 hypothetical protein [Nitrosopumilaceae archaeon]NIX61728.1 hypothetical protein [Nitrosopumilaceae archaeon]
MGVLELYHDYGISYQTEGHKHCVDGWANTACPFCEGEPGLHLGVHLETWVFNCWRCGWKPTEEAIAKLIKLDERKVRQILPQYRKRNRRTSQIVLQKPQVSILPLKLPTGCGVLQRIHRRYLESRRFDPDKIIRDWAVLGTGPVASLDKIDYKFRLIVPIYWKGRFVSFQSRDISKKAILKYKTCPKQREVIHHKKILYGNPSGWGDIGICVEGIFDVWRLGIKSFATFGIQVKVEQIIQMSKHFRRILVLFDSEKQAQKEANKLVSRLRAVGISSWVESLSGSGDPADLNQIEADYIVRQLTKRCL